MVTAVLTCTIWLLPPPSLNAYEYMGLTRCELELKTMSVESCLVGRFRSRRYRPTGRLSRWIRKKPEALKSGRGAKIVSAPVSNLVRL